MTQHQPQAIEKMAVRDFRNYISKAHHTLAITNHGRTIGYYIPVRVDPTTEDFTALKKASKEMADLLEQHNLSDDDIVSDFRKLRKTKARDA